MIVRKSETFSGITLNAGSSVDKNTTIVPPAGYSLISDYFTVTGSGSNGIIVNSNIGSISIYSAYGCSGASVTHYMVFAKDDVVTV